MYLIEAIQERDKKLLYADEILRFDRDISEALLKKLNLSRQEILQNSLQSFDFYSEYKDFNKGMTGKRMKMML